MTQWVEDPSGGRDRGPRAVARAWVEVLLRPKRFFRTGVAPGDQAPGLTFAMAVVLIEEATRLWLVSGALPPITGSPLLSTVIALGVATLLVAPAVLHLVAAVQTVLLVGLASDRGGVNETIQVIGYATAPCVLSGVAVPEVRVACAAYGAAVLIMGTGIVHGLGRWRAVAAGAVPAAIVFGYGFRGFGAAVDLLVRWYII